MDEYLRRVGLLRGSFQTKAITYNWHSPEQGFIEAALARADRRVGGVIEAAWRLGARLDSWSEFFMLERWQTAFEQCGLDPAFYALRERTYEEILPWSVVSAGLRSEHLWHERMAALENKKSPDCSEKCMACGVMGFCDNFQLNKPTIAHHSGLTEV
jgi:hypothetical protein